MGCRSSNLAVVTTPENAPSAANVAAQFIMVHPGDLEKDFNFLKTNGFQKPNGNGNSASALGPDENVAQVSPNEQSTEDALKNSKTPSTSLLRVKNGILSSPYAQYRKPIPNISIWKYLNGFIQKNIEKYGQDYEWLIEVNTKTKIKYGDIETSTRKLASALYRLGMQSHDVVLFLTTNTTHTYLVLLALWRLNVAAKISSPEDSTETLIRRLKESNARYIVCDGGTVKSAQEAQKKNSLPTSLFSMGPIDMIETVDIMELMDDDGSNFPGDLQDFNLDVNNDGIYIPCTSGTTGVSKGVLHTHKTVIAGLMQGGYFRDTSRFILMPLKVYHLSGVLWPLASLMHGKTCLLIETISTQGILEAIQEYAPATVCGFPTFLITLSLKLQENGNSCASVTSVLTSGETISGADVDKIKLAFPNLTQVDVSYVTAEILSVTSTVPYSDPEQELGSPVGKENKIGNLCCYSSAKVIDPDTGQILQVNQSGELCFRTHSIMRSYVNQPEGMKKTMINGWIHSGDCGYYDEHGTLYATGRLNEVFKCDGVYVSPIELESILHEHPDVEACAVVGVPNELAGAYACAVVSRRFGATVNATEIRRFVDNQVDEPQQLRGGVVFIDDLPKTNAGKISRAEVLRMVLNLNKMKSLTLRM